MRDEKEGRKKQAKSNKQQSKAQHMYVYVRVLYRGGGGHWGPWDIPPDLLPPPPPGFLPFSNVQCTVIWGNESPTHHLPPGKNSCINPCLLCEATKYCVQCVLCSMCTVFNACCVQCVLCSMRAVFNACCVQCVLCSMRAVFNACCVQCVLCSMRAVFNACCVQCVLCSMRAVFNACCVQCVLCSMRTVFNVYYSPCHRLT